MSEPLPPIPSNGDVQQMSKAGYDKMGQEYLAFRAKLKPFAEEFLEHFLTSLLPEPSKAHVLELGCGAGVPCTREIAARCAKVTGNDISTMQIELARENLSDCPNVTLVEGDMMQLAIEPGSLDAVIAFYSLCHLSPTDQERMLELVRSWLKPNTGLLFCNFPSESSSGTVMDWLGVPTYFSSLGSEGAVSKTKTKGFEIVWQEESRDVKDAAFFWIAAKSA